MLRVADRVFGDDALRGGCVVRRDAYHWMACPGAERDGIDLVWNRRVVPEPPRRLAGLQRLARYTRLADAE